MIPTLIICLTAAAFFPVLQNDFVYYDDEGNLLGNPYYRGLGWNELRWMFTTFHMTNYRPLTWVTLGLDYTLWGMNPLGYHLTSVLLHGVNAVLFYFLSLSLLRLALAECSEAKLRLGSGFAALLFALHPLRVESVGWVSARNDLVSAAFIIGAVISYIKAAQAARLARLRWLTVAVFLYAMSLLSKGSGMVLPFVLVVLDVYPLRRLAGGGTKWIGRDVRHIWWEKIPFLLLSFAAGVLALIGKSQEGGSLDSLAHFGLVDRLLQSAYGVVFYIWKSVVPLGLSPIYELPVGFDPWQWLFLLSAAIVIVASILFIFARRRFPAGLAAWVCYLAILAPVSGLIQYGPQIVADRYSYLACLGWTVLLGAGLTYGLQSWGKSFIGLLFNGVGAGVIIFLGVLTWGQARVWRDTETLWRYALSLEPKSRLAHNNLGVALIVRGEWEEAISHFRQVIAIDPLNATAFYNLGNVLAKRGDLGEAIQQFRQAVKIDPLYASAHYNLGNVLSVQGQFEEAIDHYRQTVRIDPGHAKAHFYLGNVLASRGNFEQAIDHLRDAVRLEPQFAEAHESLARALAIEGKKDEAAMQYQEAVRILKSRNVGAR